MTPRFRVDALQELDDEAMAVLRSAEWTLAKIAGAKLSEKAKAEWAQEEARLAAERQAREAEYTRARVAAAEVSLHDQHADAERFRRHLCDLAAEAPRIRVEWLTPKTDAARIVGAGNALAHLRECAIVTRPIISSSTGPT